MLYVTVVSQTCKILVVKEEKNHEELCLDTVIKIQLISTFQQRRTAKGEKARFLINNRYTFKKLEI